MKTVRLPSGILARVLVVRCEVPVSSKSFLAYSGSVEAIGRSEADALDALEKRIGRMGEPYRPLAKAQASPEALFERAS